jgi:hypothetical protein
MSARLLAAVRRHLTFANVTSTLAVFFVLAGGTALAVGLPRNSVNSRTVKNNSLISADLADGKGVLGADVADGSLTGPDLADGSAGAAQLAAGAVGHARLAPNSVTAAGVADGAIARADVAKATITGKNIDESTLGPVLSAEALDGHPFAAFLSSFLVENTRPAELGADLGDGTRKISQSCPPNSEMVSGGPIGIDPPSTLVESFPKDRTWTVRINPHGKADTFRVVALCAV